MKPTNPQRLNEERARLVRAAASLFGRYPEGVRMPRAVIDRLNRLLDRIDALDAARRRPVGMAPACAAAPGRTPGRRGGPGAAVQTLAQTCAAAAKVREAVR